MVRGCLDNRKKNDDLQDASRIQDAEEQVVEENGDMQDASPGNDDEE